MNSELSQFKEWQVAVQLFENIPPEHPNLFHGIFMKLSALKDRIDVNREVDSGKLDSIFRQVDSQTYYRTKLLKRLTMDWEHVLFKADENYIWHIQVFIYCFAAKTIHQICLEKNCSRYVKDKLIICSLILNILLKKDSVFSVLQLLLMDVEDYLISTGHNTDTLARDSQDVHLPVSQNQTSLLQLFLLDHPYTHLLQYYKAESRKGFLVHLPEGKTINLYISTR